MTLSEPIRRARRTIAGKIFNLPELIQVENGLSRWSYILIDFRAPKKGEIFVSGCQGFEQGYIASKDMTSEQLIIETINEYKPTRTVIYSKVK